MLIHKFKNLEWRVKSFVLPTVALLLFGIMSYFLGEACGSYLDEWKIRSVDRILSSLVYDKYLLWLAWSIFVGFLLYRGMIYLCKANIKLKRVRAILAVILAAWNVFMTIACIMISIDTDDRYPIYEGSDIAWFASRSEEIQRMRSESVLFGRGDHYYTYPDSESLLRENYTEENEVIREVTNKEQTRAYHTFVRWRSETLLPVLAYCFGKWVGVLYSVIVPLWFVGSIAGFTAVKGKGRRVLYGSCMSLVGIQLLLTLLDYYGIACWEMPMVFSTADWTAMIPVAMIQLTVMLFLIMEKNHTTQSNELRVTTQP